MSVLDLVVAPDPVLKKRAQEVEEVNDEIRSIMDDMLKIMYEGNGAGLAANQVGVLKRIIVVDLQEDDDVKRESGFYPLFMANPVITNSSDDKAKAIEGCLSVPEERIEVSRSFLINVEYLDYNNNLQKLEATGWLARAIQHEVDHLNGKTLLDYLSSLKRDVVLRRLVKFKRLTA